MIETIKLDLKKSVVTKLRRPTVSCGSNHWPSRVEGCCCCNYACLNMRTFDPASATMWTRRSFHDVPLFQLLPSFELLLVRVFLVPNVPIPSSLQFPWPDERTCDQLEAPMKTNQSSDMLVKPRGLNPIEVSLPDARGFLKN